jgi:hypothetical protein
MVSSPTIILPLQLLDRQVILRLTFPFQTVITVNIATVRAKVDGIGTKILAT